MCLEFCIFLVKIKNGDIKNYKFILLVLNRKNIFLIDRQGDIYVLVVQLDKWRDGWIRDR